MWSQVQQGRLLRARCDYIFGTDQSHIDRVEIMDVSNYAPYHFVLRDRLLHLVEAGQ